MVRIDADSVISLLPLMFTTYMLQYLDKVALGYAAVLGLSKDTVSEIIRLLAELTSINQHLVGQQYSWCSSVFYFGYLAASLPGSLGFIKFPIAKYMAGTIFCWSVVLACHGAASNFASLIALRFLLGAFESVISPGFSLITGLW